MEDIVVAEVEGVSNRYGQVLRLSRAEFVERLKTREQDTKEEGALFAPVVLKEPAPAPPHRKPCQRGESYVAECNTVALSVVVFDLDTPPTASPERVTEVWAGVARTRQAIEAAGLEYVLARSFRHRPDFPRLRLVLFPSRPITAEEWPELRHRVAARFHISEDANGDDSSAKDVCQLYYWPARPAGAEDYWHHEPGASLDVDEVLADYVPPAPEPEIDTSNVTLPDDRELTPADRERFTSGLRDYVSKRVATTNRGEQQRAEIVRRVLGGRPVAEPGGRNGAATRLGGIMGTRFSDMPVSVASEFVLPSLEFDDGDEVDAFERAFLKCQATALAADREVWTVGGTTFGPGVKYLPAEQTATPAPTAAVSSVSAPESWKRALKVNDGDRPLPFGHNAYVYLSNDPCMAERIRWNAFHRRVEIRGQPWTGSESSTWRQIEDHDETALTNWFQRVHSLKFPKDEISRQVELVARDHSVDPLQEYLNGATWDGTERLDRLLITYGGAADTEYTRAVTRAWMVSAVARAFEPGVKVDTVLVLEGAQGLRKSTLLRVLAGREFFSDSPVDIGSKDALMLASRVWICELAEVASLRKAEAERIKAFFSSSVDTFRPAYGRHVIEVPRRCVFAGTTNAGGYLVDPSGNRRFWPVALTRIDIESLEQDRDQLWAEAVRAFRAGEQWHLSPELARVAALEAADRMQEDPWEDAIRNYLRAKGWPELTTTAEVSGGALDLELKKQSPYDKGRLTAVLKRIGYEHGKVGPQRKRFLVRKFEVPPVELVTDPAQVAALEREQTELTRQNWRLQEEQSHKRASGAAS